MRAALLLLIAVIAVAAFWSRKETVAPSRIAMPMTCSKAQFDTAIEELETIAIRRDEILARADSYQELEPVEYLRRTSSDEAEFGELSARAEKVFVPRCLHAAKEMYQAYVEKSRIALEARRPGDGPSTFREKRETADTVYGQFKTEVAQQRKNAQ
jgi:hypothetical protein